MLLTQLQIESKPQIAYYRVSTDKQGETGFGLDAQRKAVRDFLGKDPDFEFVEVKSGKLNNRLIISKALIKCKEINGRLVVAKLDRLARNCFFINNLIENKVDFICADNPYATKFLLQILAPFAELESEMSSIRTKAALKAKVTKERLINPDFKLGRKIGSTFKCISFKELTPQMQQERIKKRKETVKERNGLKRGINPGIDLIKSMHLSGKPISQIVFTLNDLGYKSIEGGYWRRNGIVRELEIMGFKAEKADKVS